MRPCVILAALLACGGGKGGGLPLGPDERVAELSASEQQLLCEDFVVALCSKPEFQGFCTGCVTGQGCAGAASTGAIDDHCGSGPITVQMVDDCGDTGELEVCTQGGGCMIDALEAACSGVPQGTATSDESRRESSHGRARLSE